MSSSLYADAAGNFAVSDGNPTDQPNFPFELLKHDELMKKSWSRLLPKRKPSKMVVERRAASKGKIRTEPTPDTQAGIEQLERVLEDNVRRSMSKVAAGV